MDFSNKTVIVTGTGNAIGKEIALHYAEKGANVIIADIDEQYSTYKGFLCKKPLIF